MGKLAFLELATSWFTIVTNWVVYPVLVLLLGVFLGKVLEQVLAFIGAEIAPGNRTLPIIAYLASWTVYVASFCLALAIINVLRIVLIFVGGAISLILAVHLLLAAVDLLRNVGSLPSVRSKWKIGMLVQLRTVQGTVSDIGVALTRVVSPAGDVLMVPNRTMKFLKPVKN